MDAELTIEIKDRRPLDLNVMPYADCEEALPVLATVAFKAPTKSGILNEFFRRN